MVALVTGASSGIGEATARRLAREPGAKLVLVARREERLRALADELGGATVIAEDLTADGAAERIAARVREEHGRLDLLVNNAGAAWRGTFEEQGTAGFERHLELNFRAVLRLTEALLPLLRESAPSAVVNVGSVAGRLSRPRSGAYSASKFALTAWSEALAGEEAAHGVHVGLVQPGFIPTEGFPQREIATKRHLRWVLGSREQVAEAVVDCGRRGKHERTVPRPYYLLVVLRYLAPALGRRGTKTSAAVTATKEP